jgi:membrane protein DedA with SNARE-associated domain
MELFLTASITDSLVNFATDVIGTLGYAGVFLLTTMGSACIPIPSEATMLFAGFKVSDGDLTLIGVIAAGVLGDLTGCLIGYAMGYYGRVELVERHPLIHIDRKRLDWAESWFSRNGSLTVFFGRLIPLVRAFVSLPAGVAEMRLSRFIPLTLAGSVIWMTTWSVIGRQVGDNWTKWKDQLHYVDYAVVVLIVAAIVYLLIRRRRGDRGEGDQGDEASTARASG